MLSNEPISPANLIGEAPAPNGDAFLSRHVRPNYFQNAPCAEGQQCDELRPVGNEILATSLWLLMAVSGVAVRLLYGVTNIDFLKLNRSPILNAHASNPCHRQLLPRRRKPLRHPLSFHLPFSADTFRGRMERPAPVLVVDPIHHRHQFGVIASG